MKIKVTVEIDGKSYTREGEPLVYMRKDERNTIRVSEVRAKARELTDEATTRWVAENWG